MHLPPIMIEDTHVRLCAAYLGSETAEIWIGPHEVGPPDDDDARVLRDREAAARDWKEGRSTRPSGIAAFTLTNEDGYYVLDTAGWAPGLYRFNWHGPAGVQAPYGTPLDASKRDLEYSWAHVPNEILCAPDTKSFVYWDPNGRGYGFRIRVREDGGIVSAGNWSELDDFNERQRQALRTHGFPPA